MSSSAPIRAGKIGRNDPCPSGAGAKFKKCLRLHPELNPKSSRAEIWWVCSRWQSEEPDLTSTHDALQQLHDPDPAKFDFFLERVFAEPLTSVDWSRLLRDCSAKRYHDLTGLYARITKLLCDVKGAQPGRAQSVAAEIFRRGDPERYGEILAATMALDPVDTEERSLENLVNWAREVARVGDLERLRERFPAFPEYLLEEPDDEDEPGETPDTEEPASPQFSREVEDRLDEIWDRFNARSSPTPEDAHLLVDGLLGLPLDATDWMEVFDVVRGSRHPRIFDVFGRIVSRISPSDSSFSFLFWGAVEEATERGETDRLPSLAREFHRVRDTGFDSDASSHVEDFLLGYGYARECLDLLEHLYPILCHCDDLMGWVIPATAAQIASLRLGHLLTSDHFSHADPDEVLKELVNGLEGEINEEVTGEVVRRLIDDPNRPPSREDMQLPLPGQSKEKKKDAWITIQAALAQMARDYGHSGAAHPARTLCGLQMIFDAACREQDLMPRKKGSKRPGNLLVYLDAGKIDGRVANECRDIVGINKPRALTMLEAHLAFARRAARHALITPNEAAGTQRATTKLIGEVTTSFRSA